LLTRTRFYVINLAALLLGFALYAGGSALLGMLKLSPFATRIVDWILLGATITLFGSGLSYAQYRRDMGDPTLPPEPSSPPAPHTVVRIVATVLGLVCLVVGGTFVFAGSELRSPMLGVLGIGLVFTYFGITGRDPVSLALARLSSR